MPAAKPVAVDPDRLPPDAIVPDPVPAEVPGDVVLPKVKARYVGVEPVAAHMDGAVVIVEPGDPMFVTTEQLEQNPVFQPWED